MSLWAVSSPALAINCLLGRRGQFPLCVAEMTGDAEVAEVGMDPRNLSRSRMDGCTSSMYPTASQ